MANSVTPPTSSETRPNGLLLYDGAVPAQRPDGSLPALRCDLIAGRELDAILALIAFFLPLPGHAPTGSAATSRYQIRVEDDRAWIPIQHRLPATGIASLADFMQVVTGIGDWLPAWIRDPRREPPSSPAWAARHGFGVDAVSGFAAHVRKRAALSGTKLSLRITTIAGVKAKLDIPEHAKLHPAALAAARESMTIRIANVESVRTGMTAGGQPVVVRGAVPDEGERRPVWLRVKSSWLQRGKVWIARQVRIMRTASRWQALMMPSSPSAAARESL